jgi:hypothetical protein
LSGIGESGGGRGAERRGGVWNEEEGDTERRVESTERREG